MKYVSFERATHERTKLSLQGIKSKVKYIDGYWCVIIETEPKSRKKAPNYYV